LFHSGLLQIYATAEFASVFVRAPLEKVIF
jgi:hypothetical protein